VGHGALGGDVHSTEDVSCRAWSCICWMPMEEETYGGPASSQGRGPREERGGDNKAGPCHYHRLIRGLQTLGSGIGRRAANASSSRMRKICCHSNLKGRARLGLTWRSGSVRHLQAHPGPQAPINTTPHRRSFRQPQEQRNTTRYPAGPAAATPPTAHPATAQHPRQIECASPFSSLSPSSLPLPRMPLP
jgi:hypothetical protein